MARTRSFRGSKSSAIKLSVSNGLSPSTRSITPSSSNSGSSRKGGRGEGPSEMLERAADDPGFHHHPGFDSSDVDHQDDEGGEDPLGFGPWLSTPRRGRPSRGKRSSNTFDRNKLYLIPRSSDFSVEQPSRRPAWEIKCETNATNDSVMLDLEVAEEDEELFVEDIDSPSSISGASSRPQTQSIMSDPLPSTSATTDADCVIVPSCKRSVGIGSLAAKRGKSGIPSSSVQLRTKDVGVQVEECQAGLYPVGVMGNEGVAACPVGPLAKPEAVLLYEDMKQRLECPVCCKISLPPVMQCRNGHVTCNNCRLKVRSCPMCREVDIDIRNLFAEKAVSFMTIPCEFGLYGCKVETPYREKDLHLKVCKHRPYNCPYIECEHKLVANDVVAHVSTAHRDDCRNSEGPEITASMILIGNFFGGDGAWSPRVITCFDRTFFDVALTRDRWLHHWVWLLGEEDEAQNFLYEITAFKGNVKYQYGGEVASLRTPDEEILLTGQCLSISDPIGKRLRDGDKIRYKLKLLRKD